MLAPRWIYQIGRAIHNPRVAMSRLRAEASEIAERVFVSLRLSQFSERDLLKATNITDIDALWKRLGARRYVAWTGGEAASRHTTCCPGHKEQILNGAERALAHRVNLLGTGDIELGTKIDWHRDYKSGFSWPPAHARSMEISNPNCASDVKIPWEISRLQWLIPAGQAYILTGDNRY